MEDAQDAVEEALVAGGLADVTRYYAVYRRRHAELRRAKQQLGVVDDLKLDLGAVAVLARAVPAAGWAGQCHRVGGYNPRKQA